jgi:hypothetical protein
MAKPKLQVRSTKTVSTKLGAPASPKPPNPLMSLSSKRKDYSKKPNNEELVSNANFGQTGLTGET